MTAQDLSAELARVLGTGSFVVTQLDRARWQWLYPENGAQSLPTAETRFHESSGVDGTLAWQDTDLHAGTSSPSPATLELTITQGGNVCQRIHEAIILGEGL